MSTTPNTQHASGAGKTDSLPEFDEFADDYDAALEQGISATGESKDYFAMHRVLWLKRRLDALGAHVRSVLDFGCGTGTATPYFHEILGACDVTGVDVSAKSIAVAKRDHASDRAKFFVTDECSPEGRFDIGFCNGVFHHIPLEHREAAVKYVYDSVRPGGLFAFWENNPWNPGTRYVMRRCPFDRDANPIPPPSARALLRRGGWAVEQTNYRFFFPHSLRILRFLEPAAAGIPLGGQYLVLCRKPVTRAQNLETRA